MAVHTLTQPKTKKQDRPKQQGISKLDRCDAECPAQAAVIVYGADGELMFCGHHYSKIMRDPEGGARLTAFALDTVDERESL